MARFFRRLFPRAAPAHLDGAGEDPIFAWAFCTAVAGWRGGANVSAARSIMDLLDDAASHLAGAAGVF